MKTNYDAISRKLIKLQESNPNETFRVRRCEHTGKNVVQVKEDADNWLCLHGEK